ncbi:hypothetical protein [Cupriavidus consociatus]|uniref:hypothetical protein n=1 Tax=Cupriavidus consociatus TaxID=2821357 RepID=UPI001AEB2172|nr:MULTISPECIES: hypothetical protein [unclassified Cupriavidus]MBP0622451.1 hypothetical protein [Cupriavidus sp. LEh25]MDK2659137.1 hypothetical protein [Cupriavidus sp. LEh21]
MIFETLVLHASDFIEWLDASGAQGSARRVVPAQTLEIRLSQAPRDLELIHKTSGTALWRRIPAGLRRVVAGEAVPADLVPPAEAMFPIAGEVRDPAGRFLPRRFALNAGQCAGQRLRMFRSPHGTRFGRAGGLIGRATLDDGTPLPWALLALRVTPPLADPFDFVAQSDAHGEFRLSLERLPALTKDAPADVYPAVLSVRAAPDGTDPDALPQALVRTTGGAPFKTELAVDIAPGRIVTLASPGRDALVLQFP